jgi:hypothetical protein
VAVRLAIASKAHEVKHLHAMQPHTEQALAELLRHNRSNNATAEGQQQVSVTAHPV